MTYEKDVAPRLVLGTWAGHKGPRYELIAGGIQIDKVLSATILLFTVAPRLALGIGAGHKTPRY